MVYFVNPYMAFSHEKVFSPTHTRCVCTYGHYVALGHTALRALVLGSSTYVPMRCKPATKDKPNKPTAYVFVLGITAQRPYIPAWPCPKGLMAYGPLYGRWPYSPWLAFYFK